MFLGSVEVRTGRFEAKLIILEHTWNTLLECFFGISLNILENELNTNEIRMKYEIRIKY